MNDVQNVHNLDSVVLDVGDVLAYSYPQEVVIEKLNNQDSIYSDIYSLSYLPKSNAIELVLTIAQRYGLKDDINNIMENEWFKQKKSIVKFYILADILSDMIAQKYNKSIRPEVWDMSHVVILRDIVEFVHKNIGCSTILIPECDPWLPAHLADIFSMPIDQIIQKTAGEKTKPCTWESLPFDKDKTLVIDDKLANIDAANDAGFKAYRFKENIKLFNLITGEVYEDSVKQQEEKLKRFILQPSNKYYG